jgi:hypothetical protein
MYMESSPAAASKRVLRRLLGVRSAGGWLGWGAYVAVFALATGIVGSAGPFEAAAADALTEQVVATGAQSTVTFRTEAQVGSALDTANASVIDAVDRLAPLEVNSTTIAVGSQRTRISVDGESARAEVRLVASDGALDAIHPVAGDVAADGVWISSLVANELGGVLPGDLVSISDPDWVVEVPVAGVYADIDLDDYGPFWSRLPQVLRPRLLRVFGDLVSPQILLSSEEFLVHLDSRGVESAGITPPARVWWRADSVGDVHGAVGLTRLDGGLRSLDLALNDPTTALGHDLAQAGAGFVQMDTQIADLDQTVATASDAISHGIVPIRAAAFIIALAVVAVGAWLVAQRRRQELTMWLIDGRSPYQVGATTALAVVPAAILGGALGLLLTPMVVAWLGPSPQTHPINDTWLVAVLLVVGVGTVGTAVGVAAARMVTGRPVSKWVAWTWEAALYAATVVLAGLVVVTDRSQATDPGVATIMLPPVAVAAVVFALLRLVATTTRYLGRVGKRLPTALFLSWRRFVAAAKGRFAAATPIAVSLGIVVVAAAMLTSLDRGLGVKALAVAGSDTSIELSHNTLVTSRPEGTTTVYRGSVTVGGSSRVTLMLIDPTSYPDAVPWDNTLGASFEDVASDLAGGPGGQLAAIVTGGSVPGTATLKTQRMSIPYSVTGSLDAAPLMATTGPTIVISLPALETWAEENPNESGLATLRSQDAEASSTDLLLGLTPYLLSTRPAAEIAAILDTDPGNLMTRSSVLNQPEFTAQKWTYDYVLILAIAASVLAFITYAFAIAAEQHNRVIADDLLTRMGATAAGRTAGVLLDIGAVILAATTIGIIAGAMLSRLTTAAIDPLPKFAPTLAAQLPATSIAGTYLAAIVAALIIALATRAVARVITPAAVLRER